MTPEEILAELQATKAELEVKLQSGTATSAIKGSYKGHKFADGHKLVRNNKGELCDTTKLLAAAADKKADGHADAVALLDWLIEIGYGYFTK